MIQYHFSLEKSNTDQNPYQFPHLITILYQYQPLPQTGVSRRETAVNEGFRSEQQQKRVRTGSRVKGTTARPALPHGSIKKSYSLIPDRDLSRLLKVSSRSQTEPHHHLTTDTPCTNAEARQATSRKTSMFTETIEQAGPPKRCKHNRVGDFSFIRFGIRSYDAHLTTVSMRDQSEHNDWMTGLGQAEIRYRVDPRDVPPEKAARRLHLTLARFNELLPNLIKRGFPESDPDTGMFDLDAIDLWRKSRHHPAQKLALAEQNTQPSRPVRRFGEKLNGGQGEVRRA